jgi:hypothetical protein
MKNSPCCLDTLYGSHISVLKDLRPALEKVLQTAKNVVYYKKEAYKQQHVQGSAERQVRTILYYSLQIKMAVSGKRKCSQHF